jgi:methionyl-tRNA formyltransferase
MPGYCRIPQDWFDYCGKRDVDHIITVLHRIRQGTPFTLSRLSAERSLFFPRLKTADNGWIDWSGSYQAVANMINAFDRPYPGARTFLYTPEDGDRLVILRNPFPVWKNPCAVPYQRGLVVAVSDLGITVSCVDGELLIKEVWLDGMNITTKVRVGQRLITPPDRLDIAMRTVAHYSPTVSL